MTDTNKPETPSRSGALTTLAVINFVFAGLNLFGAGAYLALSLFFKLLSQPSEWSRLLAGHPANSGPETALESAAHMAMVTTIIGLLMVIPMIVVGVGLLKRRVWARRLALLLASMAGIAVMISIMSMQFGGAVWHGAYCITVLAILLNKNVALEFA